jgi:hypothetical protein
MVPAICSSDMQGDKITLSAGGKRKGEKANVAPDETGTDICFERNPIMA